MVGSREENDANEIVKNNDMRRKKWIDFYIVWNWEKKNQRKWSEENIEFCIHLIGWMKKWAKRKEKKIKVIFMKFTSNV